MCASLLQRFVLGCVAFTRETSQKVATCRHHGRRSPAVQEPEGGGLSIFVGISSIRDDGADCGRVVLSIVCCLRMISGILLQIERSPC